MNRFIVFFIFALLYAPSVYAGFPRALPTGRTVDESIQIAKKMANAGNVGMMTALGHAYLTGDKYIAPDFEEGIKWIKMAVEQDYAPAKQILGTAYFRGTGVPKDDKLGFEWVQKAADDGDDEAFVILGTIYSNGNVPHVPQDLCKGHKYYEKASEANNRNGQYFLAHDYLKGTCCKADKVEAARLFTLSAEQGNADAMRAMAILHFNGQGVPQDDAKGVEWLTKSAEADQVVSQYSLAVLYLQGAKGVARDRAKALEWLEKASSLGSEDAKKLLEKLKTGQL